MYFYHKDGIVKFISSKKQKTDLQYIKYTPTKSEKEKIEQNWHPKVKGEKIELEKPAYIKKQEKIDAVQEVKNALPEIQNLPTRQALEKLLNIIST